MKKKFQEEKQALWITGTAMAIIICAFISYYSFMSALLFAAFVSLSISSVIYLNRINHVCNPADFVHEPERDCWRCFKCGQSFSGAELRDNEFYIERILREAK